MFHHGGRLMEVGAAMVRTVFGFWPGMLSCARPNLVTRSACASLQRSRRGSPKRRVASGHGHSPAGRSARQLLYKYLALNLRFISLSTTGQSPVFALYEPVLSGGCVSRALALEDTLKRIRAVLRIVCRYTPRVHTSRTRGHCPWRHHISAPDQALKN